MTKNMTPGLRARLSLQLLFPVAFADAARVERLLCHAVLTAAAAIPHTQRRRPSALWPAIPIHQNTGSLKRRAGCTGTINTLVRINLKMKALHRPSLCFTNLTALQLVCQRSSRKITDRDRIPHKTYFRSKQKLSISFCFLLLVFSPALLLHICNNSAIHCPNLIPFCNARLK